jgi:hypothetical protein
MLPFFFYISYIFNNSTHTKKKKKQLGSNLDSKGPNYNYERKKFKIF